MNPSQPIPHRSGPRRPGGALLAAAGLPIAACVVLVGCAPSSVITRYGGTGSLQVSGDAAVDLVHQNVAVTTCVGTSNTTEGTATSAFSVIHVGNQCRLRGRSSGTTVVAEVGGICTLPTSTGVVHVRVTDAQARIGLLPRYRGVTYDHSSVELLIGGEIEGDDGKPVHVLYRYRGGIDSERDATDWCNEERAAMPQEPEPAHFHMNE